MANKKAVQEINAKRKQQYSEEDYRRLESLMYDKLTVKLKSTQASLIVSCFIPKANSNASCSSAMISTRSVLRSFLMSMMTCI